MASDKAVKRSSTSKEKPGLKKKKHTEKSSSAKNSEPSSKSAEYVVDSDEEEEPAAPIALDSNSDSDASSTSPAVNKIKGNGKSAKSTTSARAASTSSESESESDSHGKNQNDVEMTSSRSKVPQAPEREPSSKTVTFEAPAPYKAPAGFEVGSIESRSQASEIFEKSSLKGKQIWYITAPASVPIGKIENMSLSNIRTGAIAFSQGGNDYGFHRDTAEDKTYTKIMVPNESRGGYFTGKKIEPLSDSKDIEHVIHIQQVVNIAAVYDPTSSISTGRSTVPARKPVRQQPKGLRMRFKPIGFGDGEVGKIGYTSVGGDSTESDAEDPAPNFRVPTSLGDDGDPDAEMHDVSAPPSKPFKSKSKAEKSLKRKSKDSGESREDNNKPHKISKKHSRQVASVN